MDKLIGLIREAHRRRVFRTAALYLVGAWLALQVAALLFQAWDIADEALRFVWFAALLALPAVLVFGWIYDISAQGIIRTLPAESGSDFDASLKRSDIVILGLLSIVIVGILIVGFENVRNTGTPGSLSAVQRVAVLPLANLTGDQEYLSYTLHDALISRLANVSSLDVISRTSANRYRDSDKLLSVIAAELGVNHLIEGSVSRIGDSIRIALQLIDPQTEASIWSQSYERDLADALILQDDIAKDVARAVEVELSADEELRLSAAPQVDPETYELYLQGMFLIAQSNPDTFDLRGLDFLHRAVERSPGDALAWAGLALGYTTLGHGFASPPDAWTKARAAAERAIRLAPDLAEAHAAMADVKLYYEWDWQGAEKHFIRANQLNSSLAMNHYHFAWYHALFGRMEEAIREHKRAKELDPFFPLHTAWLGGLYLMDGDADAAIEEALASLEIVPDFPHGLFVLGDAYREKGEFDKAIQQHRRLAEILPRWQWGLGMTYADAGMTEEALAIVAAIEADGVDGFEAMGLSVIYGMLGDIDQAYKWIEFKPNHAWLPWLRTLNYYEPIRQDPRYKAFLENANLPE